MNDDASQAADDGRAAIDRIARLRAIGFAVVPLPNLLGYVDGLLATRFRDGWVESVMIRGPECAIATQVPNTFDPADPFAEPETLWSRAETVVKVVDEILTEPGRVQIRPPPPVRTSRTPRHRKSPPGVAAPAREPVWPSQEPPTTASPTDTERR
ncbi:MAG: hypothetical protein JOZ47_12175 [Kutzneria sp.]|nr:hypothetical protein [Kutzneria sp.]